MARMEVHPNRRQFLGITAVMTAALVLPSTSMAESKQDKQMETNSTGLAKPLAKEAEALYADALQNLTTAASERLKTKLPENSEPCFTYQATEYKGGPK